MTNTNIKVNKGTLAELCFELKTSRLTAHVATDWATWARLLGSRHSVWLIFCEAVCDIGLSTLPTKVIFFSYDQKTQISSSCPDFLAIRLNGNNLNVSIWNVWRNCIPHLYTFWVNLLKGKPFLEEKLNLYLQSSWPFGCQKVAPDDRGYFKDNLVLRILWEVIFIFIRK